MANLLSTTVNGQLNIGNVIDLGYTVNGSISTTAFRGINFHSFSDYNYLIGKRAGAWTQPLDITFYTGIRYHAHQAYGGHKFYTGGFDSNFAFSIGDGDANVRIANTLIFSSSNGTMISNGTMTDAIGYNTSYGTYIGSTVGGTYYIYGNGRFYDNGTIRTLIHSGNIGSQSVNYATSAGDSTNLGGRSSSRYLYYRGYSTSGDFQSLQSSESIIRFDQVGEAQSWSNAPGGYTYGGVLSMRGDNFGFQIWGSHTGDLYYKTQWNNDQYSGWRYIVHSGNIGSQSVSYASNADTVDNLHASDFVRAYTTSSDNIDSNWGQSFKTFDPVPSGTPPIASPNLRTINIGESFSRRTQLAFDYATDRAWFRRRDDGGWQTWREFIHSGNIGSQNVNSASYSNYVIDSSSVRITSPVGAFSVNNGYPSGAIRINLPRAVYNNNTMMSMTVDVYEYSTGQSFTLRIGGYNYLDGGWYNVFASLINDSGQNNNIPVYFGNNGSDRNVIWIGEPNWGFAYPNVFVRDFQAGHSQNSGWASDWSISFDPNPRTNVGANRIAYKQIDAGNISSQSVSYATSAGTLSSGATVSTLNAAAGTSFVAQGYNNNGGFAMNNASTYWGLMWNYGSNDWRLGRGSQIAQNGWNLRWDASDNVYTNGTLNANYFRNGSVWINNGTDYNDYNENIRLFNAPNGVSVIAFSASGTGGTPITSLLGFSDRLETRVSNTWEQRIYGGYVEARGSFRAPIFYDSDDTGYYLDPNGSSNLNNVTANQSYANGWFRNNGSNTGLYNQSTTMHWSSNVNGYWDASSTTSVSSIRFYTGGHLSAIRGYVYANDSNQIGFLNNGGSWALRTTSDKNALIHGTDLTINADGAGSSNIVMNDGDEGSRTIHCNSNRIGFLNQSSSWGSWCNDNGGWQTDYAMYSPIYYDANDGNYFLDPNADLSLRVYGEICNSNYADGKMQPGALNIGRIDTNYAWDGTSWASDIRLGLLANTSETWEFGIHDSGDSVMSVVHFDGGSTLTMGRNLGWGQCTVNSPAGYVSNSNPWGTSNSAFFPNGITTAGGTNWIYGFTYIGNAPANGNGHEFNANGTQYSTTSITTPTFIVNSHSDNTRGYRIHNTSGTAVSAMFVNSSNQLVFAAGAVDQINLNKKVYVNGVALGVNVSPSATAGRIDASNDIVAYSSSDERLKYNITPIENAIDKVKSLTGVEFDWKPEYKHAHGYEGHDTGIIAQQVQEVIPSAVRTNDTGFLAVRYEKLIGLLIEANKELAARVEELEKKLG